MKFVPTSITRSIARSILVSKKNSPHIFFVGGIAAVAGGTILACQATLKLEENLDEIKQDLKEVKTLNNSIGVMLNDRVYSEQDYYRALTTIYVKSAMKLGKLYGPAVIVGGVGIAALTGSHIQLARRNTALTATLAAVMKAFDEYRVRVAEEVGEKRELELHRAVKDQQAEINGKKQTVKVTDPDGWSPYAKEFDETNGNWRPNSEFNRVFIECQQRYMNDRLQARGHVFLNEVYDALGMEHTQAGALVGWVRDSEDGDNYVDYGLYLANSMGFINGSRHNIILDFNVDGVIYDKI